MKATREPKCQTFDECVLYLTENEAKQFNEILRQTLRQTVGGETTVFDIQEISMRGRHETKRDYDGSFASSGNFTNDFRVVVVPETLVDGKKPDAEKVQ
jgi:hypothetical protein